MLLTCTRLRAFSHVLVLLVTLSVASAQQCDRFAQGYDDQLLVSFLKQELATKSDAVCIAFALRELETDHAAPVSAAPLLTEYLDFKRPLTQAERAGAFRRPPTTAEMYPASSALYLLGKSALPALLKAMSDEESTADKRRNAISTVMDIYQGNQDEGIRFLRTAGEKTKDPARAQRLAEAAKEALRWCIPEKKAACEAAMEP